jgi:hypothetical protein
MVVVVKIEMWMFLCGTGVSSGRPGVESNHLRLRKVGARYAEILKRETTRSGGRRNAIKLQVSLTKQEEGLVLAAERIVYPPRLWIQRPRYEKGR